MALFHKMYVGQFAGNHLRALNLSYCLHAVVSTDNNICAPLNYTRLIYDIASRNGFLFVDDGRCCPSITSLDNKCACACI